MGLRETLRRARIDPDPLESVSRDSRTPLPARIIGKATVGLARSPTGFVPRFLPVLGRFDDAVLIPLGCLLVRFATRQSVIHSARIEARRAESNGGVARWVVTGFALATWALLVLSVASLF